MTALISIPAYKFPTLIFFSGVRICVSRGWMCPAAAAAAATRSLCVHGTDSAKGAEKRKGPVLGRFNIPVNTN